MLRLITMKPGYQCDPTDLPLLRNLMVLQEKWVLFVVWELLRQDSLGFNELCRRSPVNPTTLAQRLDLLENQGIVTRTVHSTIPPKTSYQLTKKGLALKPVLEAIRAWADQHGVVQDRDCAPHEECVSAEVEEKSARVK